MLYKLILYYFYTYIVYFALHFSCLNVCVGWEFCSRLWAWKGLPQKTYNSMYARTKRCYNERGSRTNYVRSSIPHCILNFPLVIREVKVFSPYLFYFPPGLIYEKTFDQN